MTTSPARITTSSFMRLWAPVLVVCVPVAWAALGAAAGDWVAIGDDAYFTVRSRDVLTAHHPLLGAWSSSSKDLGTPISNLGPLQLDLLAPFTRWTPWGGTAIGTALVNIAAIVTIAWLVRRIAGERAVLPAMGAVALLLWTMGSEMLITPRQHQAMVLPYLCLLLATWATSIGDRWAIVAAVVTASLVTQTHLSYPVLVAALTALMVVGQVIVTRRGEARGGRRPFLVAGVLAVVLWLQTAIDQFFGEGNFGNVLTGSGGAGRAGFANGIRIVAAILISPHAFVRPGFREFDPVVEPAAAWQTVVLLCLLTAAVVLAVMTCRKGGWERAAGTVVAIVAVVAGIVNAMMLPRTQFGLTVMNYRWLWATATFVVLLVLVEGERWASRRFDSPRGHQAVLVGLAALCVVPSLASLPRSVQHGKYEVYLAEQGHVKDVLEQIDGTLASLAGGGPVVVDETGMYFGHGYTYPLLVAMQEHGIEFRFDPPYPERRFGSGRISDGTETQRLRLVSGGQALEARDAPNLVAFADDPAQPVAILLEPI